MSDLYPLKIDVFSHIIPPGYDRALCELSSESWGVRRGKTPALSDIETRFRIMDRYDGLAQVLSLASPTVDEMVADPKKVIELAKVANDGMAELVAKYPDRFVAAVACLPMIDMDAALDELDRAIRGLRFRGVQIYTPANGKPLDSPEFMPIYEKMSKYNLPILIHPSNSTFGRYSKDDATGYMVYTMLGWPYETTVAMARLVLSGVLERFPNLKFITHHCGGMAPYFEQRIIGFHDFHEARWGLQGEIMLTKSAIEYYKMFYNDTAIYGNTPALMCAYAFSGVDHMVFATDFPLGDSQCGYRNIRQTINAIERMEISDADKKKIYEDNARALFRLPV